MLITILIPVHNHIQLTQQMLKDLSSALDDSEIYRIVVINDGSTDGTSDWIKANYPNVYLLQGDGNLWWSGAMNKGAKFAIDELQTDFILLWNNDIVFDKAYFTNIISVLNLVNTRTIIGSCINIAGTPNISWSRGGYFDPISGKHGMYGYYNKEDLNEKISEVDWLTGMGTIIHKDVIQELNFWDKLNFPQYYGDCDLTYRAKLKGIKIIVHPLLKIYNRIEFSGTSYSKTFRELIKAMSDNRSKINIKKDLKWYRLYAKSYKAYLHLIFRYIMIFGGFIKWRFFGLFGLSRKPKMNV